MEKCINCKINRVCERAFETKEKLTNDNAKIIKCYYERKGNFLKRKELIKYWSREPKAIYKDEMKKYYKNFPKFPQESKIKIYVVLLCLLYIAFLFYYLF